MAFRDYLAGEVAQDCADGVLSRREALRRLALMGMSTAAATTVLAGCGGDDDGDAGATTSPAILAPTTTVASAPAAETIEFGAGLIGAYAGPADPERAVLLVHENRGLTPHFVDLVGRFAGEGYAALCVDLLSPEGGTAALGDEGAAVAALAARDAGALVADLRAGIDELQRRAPGAPVGAVGFCFGGAMVWTLLAAGEDRLAAAVPFYGPAPAEPDFSGARAAVLGIYAGLDDRVNATRPLAAAALDAAGLTYELRTFDGVDHAFFNDTGPRYDEAAATEAYALVLGWFEQHLA